MPNYCASARGCIRSADARVGPDRGGDDEVDASAPARERAISLAAAVSRARTFSCHGVRV